MGFIKWSRQKDLAREIVVQIVAVRSALNQVAKILLKDHASHCLLDAAGRGDFELAQGSRRSDLQRNLESELASFRKALDLML